MLECIPDIVTPAEIKTIRSVIRGGTFVDGRTTAGLRAQRVKENQQLDPNAPSRDTIDRIVFDGLRLNAEFQRIALPRVIQKPMFNRYAAGMTYGAHVDDALMGNNEQWRTDVSVTVFLSQPDEYEGGELEINSGVGPQTVKLPAGWAVVYPSSTVHQVMPVTEGERLAAITWVQSKVRDPSCREILADLDLVRQKLSAIDPDGPETEIAFKTYTNLLRRWADV